MVAVRVQIEVENFFPHWNQETEMILLSGVFLRDLKLDRFVCFFKATQQRRDRFARLKIDWTVLDLNNDVLFELSIERMEIIVGGFGAIVARVAPIEMMVVDEGAVKDDAVVRLQGASNDVGGVDRCPAIDGRAQLTLRVGFDREAAKIRDSRIKSFDLLAPPIGDARVEWIKGIEITARFRCAQIDRDRELNAPRAKGIRNANELRKVIVVEKTRIGIDVVDGAAVDADGCQKARVRGNARKVRPDVTVLEKYGAAGVAAFDGAVEIIPLIDPSDGSVWLLCLVQVRDRFATGDFAEKRKRAVHDAPIVEGSNCENCFAANVNLRERKAVHNHLLRRAEFRNRLLDRGDRSKKNC